MFVGIESELWHSCACEYVNFDIIYNVTSIFFVIKIFGFTANFRGGGGGDAGLEICFFLLYNDKKMYLNTELKNNKKMYVKKIKINF